MLINEMKSAASSYGLLDGYIYIASTDKIILEKYNDKMTLNINDNNVLECRIFNSNGEYKAIRTDLTSKWHYRYVDDAREYIEEKHYLDIDTKKCVKLEDGTYNVTSTGGGRYHLPFNKIDDVRIVLHNYVDYEKDGQIYVYDYRLVGFEGK